MTTTELDRTIADLGAALRALEQAHGRQVRAVQAELGALTAQRWLKRSGAPRGLESVDSPARGRAPAAPLGGGHHGPARRTGAETARRHHPAGAGGLEPGRVVGAGAGHAPGLALDEEELALQDVRDLQVTDPAGAPPSGLTFAPVALSGGAILVPHQ